MSLVIRDDLSVPLPEEMAEELGLHRGSPVQWHRAEDGSLRLSLAMTRDETIRAIRGAGRKHLAPGESGMEGFLEWRQAERELDDTY